MKKVMLALGVAFLASCNAFAGTSVNWFFGWGMYPNGASDLTSSTAGTGVAASQSVLWQLVSAGGNDTIDVVNLSNSGYVGEDDAVVFSRVVPAGGGGGLDEWLYGTVAESETATSYTGQTLFMRVFYSDTPIAGGYYWNSSKAIVAEDKNISDPFRTPQTFQGNTDSGSGGDALNIQIVPEPSTVALMLVGLGLVGYRRFRRA